MHAELVVSATSMIAALLCLCSAHSLCAVQLCNLKPHAHTELTCHETYLAGTKNKLFALHTGLLSRQTLSMGPGAAIQMCGALPQLSCT